MSVLTPDHVRANDNIIVHSNGKRADRDAIAAFAGMGNNEVFRRAIRGLKKKGVIAETEEGVVINPEYATIGSNTLEESTYNGRIVKLSATPLRNRPHMVFCSQGTS